MADFRFRVGSLCTGYGGIELALENLIPAELRFVADIDKGANMILAHRFPDVPNLGDLTKVDWIAMQRAANRKLDDEQKLQAVRLYESGLALAPIAQYFGVTRQAMWDMLRRRTTLRPQARYGADNHFYRGGSTADDHAQNMAEYAIASGVLVRPSRCAECDGEGVAYKDGRARIQAHHPDYNKPLDVMWLCKDCHHRWHEQNTAIPLRGGDVDGSLADVDILTAGFP